MDGVALSHRPNIAFIGYINQGALLHQVHLFIFTCGEATQVNKSSFSSSFSSSSSFFSQLSNFWKMTIQCSDQLLPGVTSCCQV